MVFQEVELADVLAHLEFIREAIPEINLTEKEIRERLRDRIWGGILVHSHTDEEVVGIVVWYELDESMYIWLGAFAPEYRRHKLCTHAFRYLEESTSYKRWFAKVGAGNIPASFFLQNLGFAPYEEEAAGAVLLYERFS